MTHTYDDEQIAMNGVYPPTPEKETPTHNTVEEVVAEFVKEFNDPQWGYVEAGIDEPWETEIVTDWLRTTLLAQNQAADERLREVIQIIKDFDGGTAVVVGLNGVKEDVFMKEELLQAIVAKHGITNL